MDRLWMLVDRLLPQAAIDGEPEARQTARLIVVFAVVLVPNGPIYCAVWFYVGAYLAGLLTLVGTAVVAMAPLTHRRTGSAVAASHQVLFGMWGVIVSTAAMTGGIASPGMYWLTLMPAFGMLLAGPQVAIPWTVVAAITLVHFGLTPLIGDDYGTLFTTQQHHIVWLSNAFTLLPVHLGIVALFFGARTRMLSEIDQGRSALQQAHKRSVSVLDAVHEGLILISPEGMLLSRPSREAIDWFGEPDFDKPVWDWLDQVDESASVTLMVTWEAMAQNILPVELCLDQLQVDFSFEGRHYSTCVRMAEVLSDEEWISALLVISDTTAERAAEAADATNRELLALLHHVGQDREGVIGFFDELRSTVAVATDPNSHSAEAFRAVHTIKGSASMYGLQSLVAYCHGLETRLRDEARGPSLEETLVLRGLYVALLERMAPIIDRTGVTPVDSSELSSLIEAIVAGRSHDFLGQIVKRWAWTAIDLRFRRIATQAKALSSRLGKGALQVHVAANDLFETSDNLAPFWLVLSHVIRNAVDHGIEESEERSALGKGSGQLWLRAERTGNQVIITLRDDGSGIRWKKLKQKAQAAGLPVASTADLERALFADYISTNDAVSETSGRGVGMAAVHQVVRDLGGHISIESEPSKGTCFAFHFPAEGNVEELKPAGDMQRASNEASQRPTLG